MRLPRRNRKGFTLAEMLVVIVIIGILAGVMAVRLTGRSQEARIARTQADKSALALALDLFEQDVGRYPSTEEGLQALVSNPGAEGWKGPYLTGGLKADPWGTPYAYVHDPDSQTYVLSSGGPDKQPGTADDIAL